MKKLLSAILVVAFLLTSLGLTSFAATDYTAQYLGDGFTRINLTNQAFVAGTERTFTVNIPEDGEYAVYFSNPNKTASTIKATFTKDGETKTASNNFATEAQVYVRLGVNGNAVVSSVALTKGEWTLAIKAGTAITVPYIDIRSTVVTLNGGKQAIYPMDANSISLAQTFGKSINEAAGTNYAKAPSDFTYYGNISDRTAPGAIILLKKKTATYKLDVKYPGQYKITAYGKLRTTVSVANEDTATVDMTVGSNSAVSGSATFVANTRVNGWSNFVTIESTVNLAEGETTVSFYNPKEDGVVTNWYLSYITVEGIDVEIPEEPVDPEPDVPVDPEPDVPVDPDPDEPDPDEPDPDEPVEPGEMVGPLETENIETPFVLTKDIVVNYTNDAKVTYLTPEYADYSNTVVTKYKSKAADVNDSSVPVPVSWTALDGATSYKLYVSKSQDFTSSDTRVIEKITATNYNIYNLETNRTYYWKVISGNTIVKAGTFRTADTVRFLSVEGVRNVRDMGGWNGLNQGMAYRGTELNLVGTNGFDLTAEGKRVMHDDLGIKTDLDLRATSITESPIGSDVNFIKVFISNYVAAFSETDKYAKIIATYADIDNYPIYLHCMGGADRTGTVAVIVEALAGADEAELSIDYELTGFSSVGARPRNSTSYKYKQLIEGLKAYDGATLQEKTENYCVKTLGLSRAQVSNVQSLMGGNKVVFDDVNPIEVKDNTVITLKNLGENTVKTVRFKGEEIPFEMNGNTITIDIETLGLGEIEFADGNILKFEANSILSISFDDISNGQANSFVTKDLELPESYVWTSSNPEIVSEAGVVTRPEFKDTQVELIASNEKGQKSIIFTVKAKTVDSHYQSTFALPTLAGDANQTAVLGTVGGNNSLVSGWKVENADVKSATITEDYRLKIDLNSKTSSIPKVYFGFENPVKEKFILEYDMGNNFGDVSAKGVYGYMRVRTPDGTIKDIGLIQYDGSAASNTGYIRYWGNSKVLKTLQNLGGTHLGNISDTVNAIRMEIDPVKMTVRFAGQSNSNWQNLGTKYGDLLNSDTSGDNNPYIADSNATVKDVNYEVLGFCFTSNVATNAATITFDNITAYAQKDCAVADMEVNVSGNSADVDVELSAAYTGTFIVGLYDASDRFTGVKMVTLTAGKTFSETIACENTPVRASVFFLEDMSTIKPLNANVKITNTALEWK